MSGGERSLPSSSTLSPATARDGCAAARGDLDRRQFLSTGAGAAASVLLGGAARAMEAPASSGDDALTYAPASELLKAFADKRLSPVEVLQAQIRRIETHGRLVNAITFTHFDTALKSAKESEQRYRDGTARPLEGITVALKDEHGIEGWTMTAGSKLFKDRKLAATDPLTMKLLNAGAIPHIQTTAPEMYFAGVTWSDLWGVTRNPWNLAITVGGSSGGSGAALAAGLTTLASGSDMGGSIRIPAAFCGLYGFKPPFGRVGTDPDSALIFPSTEGPLARTLLDTILMENAIAGPVPFTPTSLRPKLTLPETFEGIRGWRIAYSFNQGWAIVDRDVKRNMQAALVRLEEQGAICEEIDLALGVTNAEITQALMKALLSGPMGADMAALSEHADEMTTYGRHFAKIAAGGIGSKEAKQAADAIAALYAKVQEAVFLKGYRAVLMPTVATTNVPADFDMLKGKISIDGHAVDPLWGWSMTQLFNLLNWMPVVAAPTGFAANGVPTGMQIAAQTFDDTTAFAVAAAYAANAPDMFARLPDFRSQT
jgi:Asp-tRNA(Asn)/Glu-tRNA(Gln) amidotransferase A subunit family amidase